MTISGMKKRVPAFEQNGRKPLDLPRYRIEFPPPSADQPGQHEAYFYLAEGGKRDMIRFHDYAEIYAHQGLYEQLFYDRLKCKSPRKVADVLRDVVLKAHEHPSELRVLDLGAGNGMVGEELAARGVSRLVGVDIIDEAKAATIRDRPGVYDHYYVTDFTTLDDDQRTELGTWSFNGLVSVAALGFGDIPPKAVAEAMDLVEVDGWIAFNIKDSFLDASDDSGFSTMVRQLIFSEYLDLHHLERYQHRFAIDGTPLNYFAIVGRKRARELPDTVKETVLRRR
ncbi:MAG: methyltransferase domain-containing protein [Gemmatimonadota bacterium]